MSVEKSVFRGHQGYVVWIPTKKDPFKKWGFFGFISEGEMMGHPFRHAVLLRVNQKKKGDPSFFQKPLTPYELKRKKKHENLYFPIECLLDIKEMLDRLHRDYFGEMDVPEKREERAKVDEKAKEDEETRLINKYERLLR